MNVVECSLLIPGESKTNSNNATQFTECIYVIDDGFSLQSLRHAWLKCKNVSMAFFLETLSFGFVVLLRIISSFFA